MATAEDNFADLRAQIYALEIAVARLYTVAAYTALPDDPEGFIDDALGVALEDAENFDADRYPNEEAKEDMRERIRGHLRRFFSAFMFP